MKLQKLPRRMYQYFWDVNPSQLAVDKYPEYVIERVLNLGDLQAVKWVWDVFGREKIVKVIKTSRQINLKTANFFSKLLGINPDEILCFNKEFQGKLPAIWPY